MRRLTIFFLFLLVISSGFIHQSYAIGKLYGRIPWLINSPIDPLRIQSFDMDVTIVDQLVTTTIEQEFINTSWHQLEGVFVYELPEDAHITSLALWKSGERIEYNLKSIDEAREVYQEIVTREDDELFPENEKGNVFRLRIYPVEAQAACKIEISYFSLLSPDTSGFSYTFPMDVSGYMDTPIESGKIELNINSQFRLYDIQSALADEINQYTQNTCRINYNLTNLLPTEDFTAQFKIDQNGNFFNLLTCTTPDDSLEDNYFTLWLTPPDSLFQDTVLVKEIVFVVDQSASMAKNQRLNHLKQSLQTYIDQLNPVYRFNILPFSTNVSKFRSDLVPATPAMKAAAKNYVSQLSADALANPEAALITALEQSFTDWTQRIIILFTDGRANAGVKNSATILYNIAHANQADVTIFPVGIGEDVDHSLLNALATQNKGYSFLVDDKDKLVSQLDALYPKIMVPALTDITLDYQGIQTLDLFPRQLGNMVQGVQQVIRGRYNGNGSINLKLNGNVGQTPVVLSGKVAFLDNTNFQIARLWAASKIDYYKNLIQQYGEEEELVNAIISFSQDYSILTPYTAFLLIEPGEGIPSKIENDPGDHNVLSFKLEQNFPNPFNPETVISYWVGGRNGVKQSVKVSVYNALGQRIATLVDTEKLPGEYAVVWPGTNDQGRAVASGTYFCKLETDDFIDSKAMVLIR